MKHAFKKWSAEVGRLILDLFFPRSCVHCREKVEAESPLRHVCRRCSVKITVIKPPRCTTCGYPFHGIIDESVETRLCPHCEGLNPAFNEGRTCVLLRGAVRSLVHTLKYRKGLYVLEDIQSLFAQSPDLATWLSDAVLVPVPLHPRRQRKRGYNQSDLIAQVLCKGRRNSKVSESNSPRIEKVLRRVQNTQSQTRHDKKARLQNLKNAFALVNRAKLNPECHYILVDDVFTTGATLNNCAKVLRRAGCQHVDVLAFGHG